MLVRVRLFARPDSFIDKISVYSARVNMGTKLGEKIAREWEDLDIDVVIPIPETSCDIALEIARILDKPYRQGFVKNRYVGRTFIMPGQQLRRKSVRRKLNANRAEFRDKNVLLVDDSIVRGTTSEQIIEMAREAGRKSVSGLRCAGNSFPERVWYRYADRQRTDRPWPRSG